MKEKKQWQKPALIVLVRRKPEEAVLQVCKVSDESSSGGTCDSFSCYGTAPT